MGSAQDDLTHQPDPQPSARRSRYDADVVVVGNGPAGLAAAIRARWVKGYAAMPCSVVVIGSGDPGGLLPWGGVLLTGPSWAYKGTELLEKLMGDVKRFSIPIYEGIVTSVRRDDQYWIVEGEGFPSHRTLAVVLASGMRVIRNEGLYYQKGLHVTFKGYSYLPTLIDQVVEDASPHGLLVIGNDRTELLLPLFEHVAERAGGLTFLLDVAPTWHVAVRFPGAVVRGQLTSMSLDPESAAQEGLVFQVSTRSCDGIVTQISCGAVLVDYNAFEHKPSLPPATSPLETRENLLATLKRDERGFVLVDRWMETSVPGLFAAGDVTGRYSSTLMALGDGVCAGFSAYRAAFRQKFGREPRLFAYTPSNEVIRHSTSDLPFLPDECLPKLLTGAHEITRMAEALGISLQGKPVENLLDGTYTLFELTRHLGVRPDALRELLLEACTARLATVHMISELRNASG